MKKTLRNYNNVALVLLVAATACASGGARTRPPGPVLGGPWTPERAEHVASKLDGCFTAKWYKKFVKKEARPPVVTIVVTALTPLKEVDDALLADLLKKRVGGEGQPLLAEDGAEHDARVNVSIFENEGVVEKRIRIVLDVEEATTKKKLCSASIESNRRI